VERNRAFPLCIAVERRYYYYYYYRRLPVLVLLLRTRQRPAGRRQLVAQLRHLLLLQSSLPQHLHGARRLHGRRTAVAIASSSARAPTETVAKTERADSPVHRGQISHRAAPYEEFISWGSLYHCPMEVGAYDTYYAYARTQMPKRVIYL